MFPAIINPATGLPGCAVNTQSPRSLGCIDGVVNYTQSACAAAGGQWIRRPTTRDECLGYTTCFVNVGTQTSVILFRTQRSASACASCRGVSLPVFTWVNATYVTPPVWTPYTWRQRAVQASANQWTRVFDRPAYQAAIDSAFVTRFAQVAATDLSCRFDRSNLYLKAVACDCIDDGAFCYSQLTSEPVGATRFCTGYASSFSQAPVTLSANASAAYATGCINANLGSVGAGRFKQAAVSLYSSLFLKTIVPDPYRFINNSKGHQVAQLLGDGVVLELSAPAPSGLTLCIELRPEIRRIAKLKVPDFALNADPYPLAAFRPLNLADAAFVRTNSSKLLICASVSASGTYFPIARTATWESDTYIDTLDKNKQVIPFLVAGAIYLAILLFNLYRLACVFLWTALKKGSDADRGKLLLPKFLLSILTLYLVIRGVYLILVPVGKMNEAPRVVDLIFAELPTYIYFSLFMLMVFWWIELYNRSTGKSVRTDFLGQMKPLFIGVNVLMYAFFLAVLIVYDHYYTAYAPSALCGVDTTPGQPRITDLLPKIYKCVVAGIAAIIAIGFIVYGGMLLWTIGGKITVHSGGSRQRLISLGVIAGVCSAGLIMQAVLLLYGAFSPVTNTRLAIALVMIAELSPAVVLLYFMRQPPLKGHGLLGDLFFCCFEGIDDSSTVGSQSATRSAGASSRASSGGV